MKNSPINLLLLATVVFSSTSCGGIMSSTENESGSQSLKVMAYNIHHANPPSKPEVIDIAAIVEAIRMENPDIIALQEIDSGTERSGPENQAEEIARRLDMNHFFAKAIDYGGGEYGVAILSKFPLTSTEIHRLPTEVSTNGEPRVLATAEISLPNGRKIKFGSTHLDAQKEHTNRLLQIKEIASIAKKEELPFIVAGDFNAVANSEVIEILDREFKRTCEDCPFTIPADEPRKAIDFIALRDPQNSFKIAEHRVINEPYASDHLPVVAEILY